MTTNNEANESGVSTKTSTSDCKCEAQIANILTRLEKVERDALTLKKMADSPATSIVRAMYPQGHDE